MFPPLESVLLFVVVVPCRGCGGVDAPQSHDFLLGYRASAPTFETTSYYTGMVPVKPRSADPEAPRSVRWDGVCRTQSRSPMVERTVRERGEFSEENKYIVKNSALYIINEHISLISCYMLLPKVVYYIVYFAVIITLGSSRLSRLCNNCLLV